MSLHDEVVALAKECGLDDHEGRVNNRVGMALEKFIKLTSREQYASQVAGIVRESIGLRSQVAELQRILKYERENPTFDGRLDSWQAACGRARQENEDWEKKCAELQRQLDEQAGQEPVAWSDGAINKDDSCLHWSKHNAAQQYNPPNYKEIVPLYALPPNLPAMIEQARSEEMEGVIAFCRSEADRLRDRVRLQFDTLSNYERNELGAQARAHDDLIRAIRARGEKK